MAALEAAVFMGPSNRKEYFIGCRALLERRLFQMGLGCLDRDEVVGVGQTSGHRSLSVINVVPSYTLFTRDAYILTLSPIIKG